MSEMKEWERSIRTTEHMFNALIVALPLVLIVGLLTEPVGFKPGSYESCSRIESWFGRCDHPTKDPTNEAG